MTPTNPTLEYFRSYIGKELDEKTPPVVRFLQLRIRQADVGLIILETTVRPDMCNPVGLLHGGMQCSIMDEALGMSVGTLGVENFFVNTNLSVDFLGKAKAGDDVVAKGHVIRAGKQMVNVQCELTHLDGTLIARSSSNFFKTALVAFRG